MSIYPPAAGGPQGLYDSSTTAEAVLGMEAAFTTDAGVVYARYCQNKQGASIPAGLVVNYGSSYGGFATDAVGDTANVNNIAGVVCASCATDGFAWVAFRGPVTNAALAATYALSASTRALSVDANARFATMVSSLLAGTSAASATARDAQQRKLGMMSNTTTTVDSGTDSNGTVFILWR